MVRSLSDGIGDISELNSLNYSLTIIRLLQNTIIQLITNDK